ncbi:MAG TPA: hypothetical protein VFK38_01000 [Candidatus Limnocylindrales bacterium]|nr:hypothetical protein [Candidatus Limnocylindrales bacterium]
MDERLEGSGFAEFDRMSALFRRTRSLLDVLLATGDLPEGGTAVLADEALPHVEEVEAGFREWLRTGETDLAELRALILQGGLGLPPARTPAEARAALVEAMLARSGAGGEREILPAPARRLAALEHARLVFAFLPRTPEGEVHFPGPRRSYADIAPPRSPGELAMRIEELERQLWAVATGHAPRPTDSGYRRTYGFFDTAERLTSFHLG